MMKKLYSENVGIYKLICDINNKIYIGKSTNLASRLNRHKNTEQCVSPRYYLQHAIKKHGWEHFSVEILETFKDFDKNDENHKKLILEREAYYIDMYNSTDKTIGYNICKHSTDNTGRKLTDEHKEKIRKAHIGRIFSEEHRKKISNHRKGHKASEEAKHNMSLSRLGKPISEESRKKRRGKLKSKETIEKMRLASTGRKHSEESKEKMRQVRLGTTHSSETIEKMKCAKLGRTHSEETKVKMREAHARRKIDK